MPSKKRLPSIQVMSALAILIVAMAWLLAVPAVVTPFTFVSLVGLLIALGWVAQTTYQNGQSTDAVGQLLYQTENEMPTGRPRGGA